MLNKFTIGKKLLLIVAVFSTVVVGMTTYLLMDMRSGMYEDRKAKLRALVEAAVNTVNRYGDLAAAGKMPLEEAQKTALATLTSMNYEGQNYFFVFERNGILRMHPTRKDAVGHDTLDPKEPLSGNYNGYLKAATTHPPLEGFSVFIGRRPGSAVNDAPKLFLSAFDKHWDWVVTTGLFVDDVDALFFSRSIWAASAVFAGLVLSLLLTLLLGRSITRPLNRTVNALEELGAGRFDADMPDDNSQTEIGRLSRAFLQFRDKLKEINQRDRAPDPHDARHRAADAQHLDPDRSARCGALGQRRVDRLDHRDHQFHRRADQPAGAERHDRGGPRGRGRPRLLGGRLRGQGAGEPDHQGH
jgi:methyl-accepting chemotaxis protein